MAGCKGSQVHASICNLEIKIRRLTLILGLNLDFGYNFKYLSALYYHVFSRIIIYIKRSLCFSVGVIYFMSLVLI
jgi:hypothetical protein